ncbi:c-type cytochrome [Derxia lacustris]|uniref:c-type cytochrome n=1 Tax=Derxia lacustris TaxID=764842 RepID=UPI000A177E60|nr:c-type cytochrome [Derxia lacustris]
MKSSKPTLQKLAFLQKSLVAASILFAVGAQAQQAAPLEKPDATRGAATAAVCSACHGLDGNANGPTFPKLASQHPDYIVKQLHNFRPKDGAKPERENAQMLGFASTLSEQQMLDVAAYFSSQKLVPSVAANKDSAALGKKIWRAGIPAKNVPACAACHGPKGDGIPAQYPRLGGQWAEYTELQLVNFRQGLRNNNAIMTNVASRLSDVEIKAVADFAAGLR